MEVLENYDVKDITLAEQGKRNIEWALRDMPVLQKIRERFSKEKPFEGLRFASRVHVTKETANLMITLKEGGAKIALAASNPLSTQDDVAAALVKYWDIPVFGFTGEDGEVYAKHVQAVLDTKPQFIIDDGGDLVVAVHTERRDLLPNIIGSCEETTTGIVRLNAMEADGTLEFPAVGVNQSMTKYMFDNRYGTGQSVMDGIFRAANILLAGKTFVMCGYGWCGRGVAMRARGLGANVIVTEVDPLKALEAAMEGYRVMPMEEAAKLGDIFISVTGDMNVIDVHHIMEMKDGAIIGNAGHFDIEINMKDLQSHVTDIVPIRDNFDRYELDNGKSVHIIAQGRLVNLVAAEGHPGSVMDMSFANQALGAEFVIKNRQNLDKKVYTLPREIDEKIASLKLDAMGIKYDRLTEEQYRYLHSWASAE